MLLIRFKLKTKSYNRNCSRKFKTSMAMLLAQILDPVNNAVKDKLALEKVYSLIHRLL